MSAPAQRKALRITLGRGREKRHIVTAGPNYAPWPNIGDEIRDEIGQIWTVTKVEETEVVASIPFPARRTSPQAQTADPSDRTKSDPEEE